MKIFVIASFLFNFTASSWAQETIHLTTKIWPPYQYIDSKTGKLTGVSVEIIKCVFAKIGTAVEIEVLPWKRAQKHVEIGIADGFFSASWNATRDKFAVRTIDIADQNWVWYTLTDNKFLPTEATFRKNALVAATLGSNMLTWLESENYQLTTPPPDTKSMLKMLFLKRFDAFMGNEMVVDRLIDQSNLNGSVNKYIERQMPVGIYFSKLTIAREPELIGRFNSAVKGCKNYRE